MAGCDVTSGNGTFEDIHNNTQLLYDTGPKNQKTKNLSPLPRAVITLPSEHAHRDQKDQSELIPRNMAEMELREHTQ